MSDEIKTLTPCQQITQLKAECFQPDLTTPWATWPEERIDLRKLSSDFPKKTYNCHENILEYKCTNYWCSSNQHACIQHEGGKERKLWGCQELCSLPHQLQVILWWQTCAKEKPWRKSAFLKEEPVFSVLWCDRALLLLSRAYPTACAVTHLSLRTVPYWVCSSHPALQDGSTLVFPGGVLLYCYPLAVSIISISLEIASFTGTISFTLPIVQHPERIC